MEHSIATIDGNEATAYVAHKVSEVIAIYPITPSSAMGEFADEWSAAGKTNIWGTVPLVVEMQSEGGAAGTVHGALQTGSLTTTFTASQGLLLMIPNMYKIAGELTSTVFHVSARSLAAQALSIFGDQSDVMAARSTGFAMLASNSVQEAQDLAMIAHAATLEARIPFLHFFDGFRTSHEVNKLERLSDEEIRSMIDEDLVVAHRARALSPDHPVVRGTAQNPDVYFQARETVNRFYQACPAIVQKWMDRFAALTGRGYHLFDYMGPADAEYVIVMMGSGAETAEETAKFLADRGRKTGVVKVRLFRPFAVEDLMASLPGTVKALAVLDRTKEPSSLGEPLYVDVVMALAEDRGRGKLPLAKMPLVVGGRYGLSSKEFTPAMAKGVFDELRRPQPKNHFTIGIEDDVTHTSLTFDPAFSIEEDDTIRCVFWGLGSDGTVGANKNSIKIIGEDTENYAQGYFYYDSKKSGQVTLSHLRFGPRSIHAPYLIGQANFVACHHFSFLERFDVLKYAVPGAVFLLNSIYEPNEVWDHLPQEVQAQILEKKLRFYVIDANKVAQDTGMGGRINTIMQTCFFAISGVLPRERAIAEIKKSIQKTYGKRGEEVVQQNFRAVDQTVAHLHEVELKAKTVLASSPRRRAAVPAEAPEFVQKVLAPMITLDGDRLPVSALPVDGTYPNGTSRWEKRNIGLEIPVWEPDLCIQCGKCVMVCPHAVIRQKVYGPNLLAQAPAAFKSAAARFKEFPDAVFSLQVSPEDCTGCGLCVEVCPVKDKKQADHKALNMMDQPSLREQENTNWEFFLSLPEIDRTLVNPGTIKNAQLYEPLFEFSGACAGCGETPYVKLVSQLFGDRAVVANATGCSSIYGGNLPTTPWTHNLEGRGPAWSNSLFEDNAEFGLGMRLTFDKHLEYLHEALPKLADRVGPGLVSELLHADQSREEGIRAQRARVAELKNQLAGLQDPLAKDLLSLADDLVRKSVWIIGGDGWAYDIGFGGLDHVLASGRNVNVLVLDTEVYSNTGGQSSKSTPRGAVARFAAKGKSLPKKALGLMVMSYGYVYVASVAMGANDQQTLRSFLEAEAYDGPSLIIAYSHCINHGIDMRRGLEQQKLAVQSGYWPLYRYNPTLAAQGRNPLVLDSKAPTIPLEQYAYNETRFRQLLHSDEQRAESLMKLAQADINERWSLYQYLAAQPYGDGHPGQ
ncbi:MAG: pyruvate:ferredoxin (flavodoxin) oxidoreductase [Anaerolineales bacterium]|jgi:pyruvate-ferredoxin/flavodoxin oxidoreductase